MTGLNLRQLVVVRLGLIIKYLTLLPKKFMRYNIVHMSQKKILIVEDSHELAESLEDMLKFKGYQTIKSSTGADGVALALSERPDLVILDLKLPDIDGFEVYRKIREDDWGKDAKIIFLTASDTLEVIPKDLDIDPEIILHKSNWGIENLASRIAAEIAS